jgi:hypothetical protein
MKLSVKKIVGTLKNLFSFLSRQTVCLSIKKRNNDYDLAEPSQGGEWVS